MSEETDSAQDASVEERHLEADLEQTWQDESPTTAKVTQIADEVDGELGTRPKASAHEEEE